jgi:RimJ/RimL family protein N-acetyltransferase
MSDAPPVIKLLDLSDIPYLIDCIKRCYGDSYPNKMMYDPVLIQEAVQSKIMHSIVAHHQDGNVIGHCALTFDGPHNASPEAGKMIVDPEYRGHHVAESMAQKRIEIAKQLDLPGFWTECVTNHPYSQHEMIAFGAQETGLILGVDPASMMKMQGLENHSDTRMSLLAFYLPLKDISQTIYLPKHHVKLTSDLCQALKIKRKIEDRTEPGDGISKSTTTEDRLEGTALISITHIGKDLHAHVTSELEKLNLQRVASIYLDLPLDQRAASHAYVELEKIGFFWGAWIPNYSVNGDILRLQKLNEDVNFDEISTARPEGESIKRYVKAEWLRVLKKNG